MAKNILKKFVKGEISAEEALIQLANLEKNIGFARVDLDRIKRKGFPEVIYCPGKTPKQIAEIITTLKKAKQDILATRITPKQYRYVKKKHHDVIYYEKARIIAVDVVFPRPKPVGLVGVVCAGTADIPVAEEAAITAERLGANVKRIFDVGVAGIHRLLGQRKILNSCRVIVVVAGMEGALPSVVGGLVSCPVIAVPTSSGYGVNFSGVAPLLTMLNTCVPGITVVNIDNGFGAGVSAATINKMGEVNK